MKTLHSLTGKLRAWLLADRPFVEHCGIRICDANCDDSDDQRFFDETRNALNLIERIDHRRFERIRTHLRYITNAELHVRANYHRDGFCDVDFGSIDFENHPEWSRYMYAATLIHEATHGYLFSKGIPYNRRNKIRIEKICRKEENRFLSRIESQWGNKLRKPFNPSDWNHLPYVERIRRIFRRIKQSKNKAQQSVPGNVG